MNPLDRLLGEELSRCLDRIAGCYGEGTLSFIDAHHPDLRGRLDDRESELAGLRLALLERYGAWQAALKALEDLWALAELKRAEPDTADAMKSAA